MSVEFLLEIGTEEIPDWMIPGALESLHGLVSQALTCEGVETPLIKADATCRRLVLRSSNLYERQPDKTERVQGPAKSAPAAAVAGFAKKAGVAPEQLEVITTAKGEYYSYVKQVPGRATKELLAEGLPGLVLKIPFPKTMYWTAKTGPRFIRPIRWIVALLGSEVIPFEIAGVKTGNVTSGHRRLGAASIPVTVTDYEQKLRENFVILSAGERRQKIESGISAKIQPDAGLLETLTYLTEYPTPITGDFDPSYLDLPQEVLVTVMRHHQKYFSVIDDAGKLADHFVAVMNIDADREGLVKRGNERVLKARFNDARFFWNQDQHKKLADRVADLANVTFQAKLGSYLEKTNRVVELSGKLGGDAHAQRAARLAKADLTTELVKEFTELQGVVGGLYARAQGEPEEVAVAIYDQYKPVSMEDSIPRTRAGQILSIADKLDTLNGCFSVGLIPTGSKDPFALRRAAQGIVKILVEGKLRIPIRRFVSSEVDAFLFDRIRYYFRDVRGFKYDEVNAILASGCDDLLNIEERLIAIQAVRPTPDFEPLAASFKRIQNILKQAQFAPHGRGIDPELIERGPESDLHAAFVATRLEVMTQNYTQALESIASLRPKVDLFFDKVLVNAPDERVRQNRLTLLHSLLAEFSTIADFSEIVTSS
ncbi:MAG TPA: glycine--tRNA ligase subunit beta [Bryobacteraceae bacterium]|jgi:glycyl-tRNA synthetase beta chain